MSNLPKICGQTKPDCKELFVVSTETDAKNEKHKKYNQIFIPVG